MTHGVGQGQEDDGVDHRSLTGKGIFILKAGCRGYGDRAAQEKEGGYEMCIRDRLCPAEHWLHETDNLLQLQFAGQQGSKGCLLYTSRCV